MRIEQYFIHSTVLTAGPGGIWYEHELVDTKDGRIVHSVITKDQHSPEQMRKWAGERNGRAS
jgi:hypothetical protein